MCTDCAKVSWNWSSGFEEEVKNIYMEGLQCDRQTDGPYICKKGYHKGSLVIWAACISWGVLIKL